MYPRHYFDYFRSFERHPRVFVAMPFSRENQPRWLRTYAPAVRRVGMRGLRVDQRKTGSSIQTDILEAIAECRLVLVDVSCDKNGVRNANVVYELGLAHACRLPEEVIVIRTDTDKLPFDFTQMRVHHVPADDFAAARDLVELLLRAALNDIDVMRDRILDRTLESLDPDARFILRHEGKKARIPAFQAKDGMYGHLSYSDLRGVLRRLVQVQVFKVVDSGRSGLSHFELTALGKAVVAKLT